MRRDDVDFFFVADAHTAIDERLCTWARWVRPRKSGWQTHPMWRNVRANWQWEAPVLQAPLNTLEAHETEKAVAALPPKNRDAIRWAYVFRRDPLGMARQLGVSKQGLLDLVHAGRTMLCNRSSEKGLRA